MLMRRVSAVPVIDEDDQLIGIVSEGDLIRRPESGTERHPSWWLSLMAIFEEQAVSYIRSHGDKAGDVMTRNLITIAEDASFGEWQTYLNIIASNGRQSFGTVRWLGF
jgi:predicted transcriptional regulator